MFIEVPYETFPAWKIIPGYAPACPAPPHCTFYLASHYEGK